jgi:hypothetical protein
MAAMELKVWIDCVCGKSVVAVESISRAALARTEQVKARCSLCGRRLRRKVTPEMIAEAVARYRQEQEYLKNLAPARTTDGSYRINPNASFAGTVTRRPRTNAQVKGAATIYHYAVYIRHPWGTDRIVVGIKKRNVQMARDTAWDRVVAKRRTGDLKIADCVPLRWVEGEGLVEVKRRTTIKKGKLKNSRPPRSRATMTANKRKVNK